MLGTNTLLSLVKPWQEAWTDPVERTAAYQGLRALGCDTFEARAWMASSIGRNMDNAADLLEFAAPWLSSGLPPAVALAWAEPVQFDPTSARQWHSGGFTVAQAELVRKVLPFNNPKGLSFDAAIVEELAWLRSGLAPDLAVLGVAAGVTPSFMKAQVAIGLSVMDRGLMTMCAHMRGVDVRSFEVDYNKLVPSWRVSS